MTALLALLSGMLWWVLYSSIFALLGALIAFVVLRWAERSVVVFNRVYFACLLWSLVSMLLILGVAMIEHHLNPPYAPLLASGLLRCMLVVDMFIGSALLWRLTPRADARRIRPTSACLAVAAAMAVGFGIATSVV